MDRPIVCIVGRPNVGKSTLFNRIVRSRIAITEDTPGVTRDRIYAEAEWQNIYFTLIDTGGLEPESDEIIPTSIRRQANLAIDTADIILFVVDGVEGITSTDRDVADLLRKSGKETILVVNKIDNPNSQKDIYDFYELGIENMEVISSEQAFGIGDLLDKVVSFFPESKNTDEESDITKISFIGKPNVGKSSIINKILGEDRLIVTNIPGTTRDAIDTYHEIDGEKYMFIDTAGLRRKRSISEKLERYSVVRTLTAVDRSDICILMIDASEGVTEQDTKIAGYAHDNGKGMIIAINKWDLIEKESKTYLKFENDIRNKLAFISYAPIVFISALTGQRINKLFDLIKLVNNNYHLRISTGVLNDIINEAVLLNPPPTDKGKRLKIYYGTEVSVGPPRFLIFINKKELLHFSYERFLENQIRAHFGFTGVPLQFEFREKGD